MIINSVIFAMGMLFGLPGKAPCFECYADDLRVAILLKDVEKVKSLAGGAYVSSDDVKNYAFSSEYFKSFGSKSVPMREIMAADNLVISVESANIDGKWTANIFFVPRRKLENFSLPVITQLGDLVLMKDYVLCSVEYDGLKISMSNNFCYYETDLLD